MNWDAIERKERVASNLGGLREPFLVPDVRTRVPHLSSWDVWHALRDLVDDGVLAHRGDGYVAVSPVPEEHP